MAVQLKVDTGAMQRLAQTLSSEVTEVLKNFQDIQIVMKGTGNYWHGDAADAAAPRCHRGAARGRADGGFQRERVRPTSGGAGGGGAPAAG